MSFDREELSSFIEEQAGRVFDQRFRDNEQRFSRIGHRHDGLDEARVLIAELQHERDAYGRLPINYKYAAETASDNLGAEATILSATLAPHKSSNVLIMAWCQVNNDGATARAITLKIKRGSTVLATSQHELPASATAKATLCFFALESPDSKDTLTYDLAAATDAGTPTATNKALLIVEMPLRRGTTS